MFAQRVRDEVSLRWLEPHHGEALFRLIDASREHLRPWFPWVNSTREPKDQRSLSVGPFVGWPRGVRPISGSGWMDRSPG